MPQVFQFEDTVFIAWQLHSSRPSADCRSVLLSMVGQEANLVDANFVGLPSP